MISTSFRGIHFAAHKRITFLARLFRGNPGYADNLFFLFFHGGKEYFRIHTESNVDRVVVVVARRDVICEKIYTNIYIYILLRRISFYHPRDAGLDAIYR